MGIASAGSGVGGLLFSLGIQAMIQHIRDVDFCFCAPLHLANSKEQHCSHQADIKN